MMQFKKMFLALVIFFLVGNIFTVTCASDPIILEGKENASYSVDQNFYILSELENTTTPLDVFKNFFMDPLVEGLDVNPFNNEKGVDDQKTGMEKITKNEKINDDSSPLDVPDDYFYSCDFYTFDWDDDGDDDSIMAEFDVDTDEESDYVTVSGYLFDYNDSLVDGPVNVSYWVYDYEWDCEHITLTMLFNGSIDQDYYYVELLLFDSMDELDDYQESDYFLLPSAHVGSIYDYFSSCDFYLFDGNSDGDDDSIMAEFVVDTSEALDYVMVSGYLFDYNDSLVDGPVNVSYWVYDSEGDYSYLNLTMLFNGSAGQDYYYVMLLLYDSTDELDDIYSSDYYLLPYYYYENVYVDDDADSSWYNASNVRTIQEGIENASDGGTVYVYSGTYYENVVVDKTISLVGEDKNTTIIDGSLGDYDNVIYVTADLVNISGFTIAHGYRGIDLSSSNNNITNNNIVNSSGYGLYIFESSNNTLFNNTIRNNDDVSSLLSIGLYIYNCYNNIILSNNFHNNSIFLFGEELSEYIHNIEDNTVNGKPMYYYTNNSSFVIPTDAGAVILVNCTNVTISDFNISHVDIGIELCYSQNITVTNNSFYNDSIGVCVTYGENNTFIQNDIRNTLYGLAIVYSCENNTIVANNIRNSFYGLFIFYSQNNFIYHNNFVNNSGHALETGGNLWYNVTISEGNYWDDYNGTDANNDGIGDSPYDILMGSDQDPYPLMYERTIPPSFVWVDDDYNSSTPGWNVDHFNNIQDAVDNVVSSGKIYVYNGTYYENIIVNKSITVKGENKNTTIIDGINGSCVVRINASDVNINSFLIKNCSKGIRVYNSLILLTNVTLLNNLIYNISDVGIDIQYSSNCVVSTNIMDNISYSGIFIDGYFGGINNTINSNTVNNSNYGIYFYYTENNYIIDNTVKNCSSNILIQGSTINTINRNIFESSTFGEGVLFCDSNYNNLTNNTIRDNGKWGIYFLTSSNNTMENNYIYNNQWHGIYLCYGSENNSIINNSIYNNSISGIYLWNNSNNTIIRDNNIFNNTLGINLSLVYDNVIYHNNFINNTVNSYDDSINNTWYNTTLNEGNYWDDYTGIDADEDNIGDTPYNITGGDNNDTYPLIYEYSYYYDLVVSVPSQVNEGKSFVVSVSTPSGAILSLVDIEFNGHPYNTSTGQKTLTAPSVSSNTNFSIIITAPGYNTANSWIIVKNVEGGGGGGSGGGDDSYIDTDTTITNPPTADANVPYKALTFENIVFDGSGSTDNGTIANYTWSFGDGNSGYGVKPVHSYSTNGNFTVKLTVTDNDGLTDTDTTYATITLDSDGDGWSDEEEIEYGSNETDYNDIPLDTDNDTTPDVVDDDDDNDGVPDQIEESESVGSNPKDDSDTLKININGSDFYLIDINKDGTYEYLYNPIGKITDVGISEDGRLLLDVVGDEGWDYYYNPSNSEAALYQEPSDSSDDFPWLILIIGIIIVIILLIIFILYKKGYIVVEKDNE